MVDFDTMSDSEALDYISAHDLFSNDLSNAIGRMACVATLLHRNICDIVNYDLSKEPTRLIFDETLGKSVKSMFAAMKEFQPAWLSEFESWWDKYGASAVSMRNAIVHAIPRPVDGGFELFDWHRRVPVTLDAVNQATDALSLAGIRLESLWLKLRGGSILSSSTVSISGADLLKGYYCDNASGVGIFRMNTKRSKVFSEISVDVRGVSE